LLAGAHRRGARDPLRVPHWLGVAGGHVKVDCLFVLILVTAAQEGATSSFARWRGRLYSAAVCARARSLLRGRRAWLAALALAAAAGCATSSSREASPLVKRAMFDLDCPREKLSWHNLGEDTWGVRGCGKQATYRQVCPVPLDCMWVRN
jgi:hypothetical protein